MFKVPEKYRVTGVHKLASDISYGNNGYFKIPLSIRTTAYVMASDGMGWEHVSVHMESDKKERTPTWTEMCKIKGMFWDKKDCVVQFHPPESEYVNDHRHVLHLWRPINEKIPMPDNIMV
jgi:hypothetical protein